MKAACKEEACSAIENMLPYSVDASYETRRHVPSWLCIESEHTQDIDTHPRVLAQGADRHLFRARQDGVGGNVRSD